MRIQIQPVSAGAVVHSETRHLAKQCIRICKKHCFFVHFLHIFWNDCQPAPTCAGQIFYVHPDIFANHLL